MDKLSMSLDAIIANHKDDKQKKPYQKKNHHNEHHQQQNRKFQPNKNFQKPHVVKVSSHGHDDRFGGKFQRHNNNNNQQQSNNAPQRQMKVVTIERPKIIKPDHVQSQVQSTSHSSVFERLGKSGVAVIFRNLKRSVQQPDVYELCRAVGDVKEVQLHHEGSLGVARAIFSNDRDAAACVAKYHGLTLDQLEMNVTIENPTPVVKSVFERLEGSGGVASFIPPELISSQQHSNVRSGLFGTALAAGAVEDDDEEVDYEEGDEELEDDEEMIDEDVDEEEEEVEEEEEEEDNGNQFVRRVDFRGQGGGRGIGGGGRGGGFGRGRGRGGGGRFHNNNNNRNQHNNNNNGNRRRNNNSRGGPVNAANLDDDLDNYMANR